MQGRPLQRSLCDGHLLVLCILPCADDNRVASVLLASPQSDSPLGCGPGLIRDPVGQAKSVAFNVEGKAKAEALLQALICVVHRINSGWRFCRG